MENEEKDILIKSAINRGLSKFEPYWGFREDIRSKIIEAVFKEISKEGLIVEENEELPSSKDVKPFTHWLLQKADKIYVEHVLGWRGNNN